MVENLISRRRFLAVCAGVLCPLPFLGCGNKPIRPQGFVKITNIASLKEGVNHFPLELVTIYKSGESLKALSLICTHQRCPVLPEDNLYICKCHGSQFDLEGRVLTGPATVDLPWFPVRVSELGDVSVQFAI